MERQTLIMKPTCCFSWISFVRLLINRIAIYAKTKSEWKMLVDTWGIETDWPQIKNSDIKEKDFLKWVSHEKWARFEILIPVNILVIGRCIRDFFITAGKPSHFAAPTTWVALQWEGTYSNNIERIQWGCSKMMPPPPKGPASQRTTEPGVPDWKSVCMWGRLKRCADQTAQTFSVKESARWRAAPTRHHALQAPTDRLPIATHCTLHPSLAHCSLLWVSRFSFYFCPSH